MQIVEPVTMITDYALAAVTVVFAAMLIRVARRHQQLSMWLWAAAFLATALASLTGGTYHGLSLVLGDTGKAILWKGVVYSIGIASFLMLSGTILASVPRAAGKWFLGAAVLQLAAYAVWMRTHDDFLYVIYDYAPAMVAVLVLQGFAAHTRRDPSARWIIAGVLVSFGAAGIQQSGFDIHQHFNHNDLYHIVQMGAVYLLYRGACLLRDRWGPR